MDETNKKSHGINDSKMQWLIAVVVTSILFGITYLTTPIIFSTNDDMRIMYALAGYSLNAPTPYHPFINLFLGKIISVLYTLIPGLPWYGLFHAGTLFLSIVIIGRYLIKFVVKKRGPLWVAVLYHVAIYYVGCLYPVVAMQFSTTSAFFGIAAMTLVFSLETKHGITIKTLIKGGIVVVLMTFSFMLRNLTWYCMICFLGLACVYQLLLLIKNKRPDVLDYIKFYVGIFFISVSLALLMRYISLEKKSTAEIDPEFEVYNEYRIEFQDYKKRYTYDEAPDLYASVGWTKNTYRATQALLFMDSDINAKSLKTITEAYSSNVSTKRNIGDAFETIKNIFINYNISKICGVAIVAMYLFCVIAFILKRFSWVEFVGSSFCFIGFLIMLFVLGYRGRLPLRVLLVIMVPTIVFLGLCLAKIKIQRNRNILVSTLITGAMLLSVIGVVNVYLTNDAYKTQTKTIATLEEFLDFELYASSRPEDIYVYDFTVATVQRAPFVVYTDNKPVNCIVSGGSYTYSSIYYTQLAVCGLSELTWTTLLQDNVYYVSSDIGFVDLVLANMIDETNVNIGYDEVMKFGEGIKVYKFYVIGN